MPTPAVAIVQVILARLVFAERQPVHRILPLGALNTRGTKVAADASSRRRAQAMPMLRITILTDQMTLVCGRLTILTGDSATMATLRAIRHKT